MERTAPQRRAGSSRPKPNLKLIEARVRADLNRQGLADLAGITEKQVGLIERGVVRKPRVATANGIAEAVKADVLALFPKVVRP